jgi:hypothetical protein
MTTYIDKVREALEYMRDNEDSTPYWSQMADAALSALQAHEAEVKELKRDAERYRYLRDSGNYSPGRFSAPWGLAMRGKYTTEELDAAVDEALAKVKP